MHLNNFFSLVLPTHHSCIRSPGAPSWARLRWNKGFAAARRRAVTVSSPYNSHLFPGVQALETPQQSHFLPKTPKAKQWGTPVVCKWCSCLVLKAQVQHAISFVQNHIMYHGQRDDGLRSCEGSAMVLSVTIKTSKCNKALCSHS